WTRASSTSSSPGRSASPGCWRNCGPGPRQTSSPPRGPGTDPVQATALASEYGPGAAFPGRPGRAGPAQRHRTVEDVRWAIPETNGQISFIKQPSQAQQAAG